MRGGLFYPVRRDACGSGRAVSCGGAVALARRHGDCRLLSFARDEGDLRAQRLARSRHHRVCPVCGSGRFGADCRFGAARRARRMAHLCGDERIARGARPDGSGERCRSSRCRGGRRGGDRGDMRGVYSVADRKGRRKRAERGNAVSVCDARKRAVFPRVRAGDSDLARLFSVSAVFFRALLREKGKRRKGGDPPRGVCVVPSRFGRDRAVAVSRPGNGRALSVSARRFLRAPFPEARRENTFPLQAGREYRSRSSRGRA